MAGSACLTNAGIFGIVSAIEKQDGVK